VITGAKNGLEVGGMNDRRYHFDDVTVTNPVNAGLEITGSTVSSTVSNLTVSGGAYGALLGAGASGSLDHD
jgi:hypothetical protein